MSHFRERASSSFPIDLNANGDKDESMTDLLNRVQSLPSCSHKWNTNEEIAAYLFHAQFHSQWLCDNVRQRPCSGSLLMYDKNRCNYKQDGYIWKKRKDGTMSREDHMRLKVRGVELISANYVHSAVLPTFHRRSYWLSWNPSLVLVHYLNTLMDISEMTSQQTQRIVHGIQRSNDLRDLDDEEIRNQIDPMVKCDFSCDSATTYEKNKHWSNKIIKCRKHLSGLDEVILCQTATAADGIETNRIIRCRNKDSAYCSINACSLNSSTDDISLLAGQATSIELSNTMHRYLGQQVDSASNSVDDLSDFSSLLMRSAGDLPDYGTDLNELEFSRAEINELLESTVISDQLPPTEVGTADAVTHLFQKPTSSHTDHPKDVLQAGQFEEPVSVMLLDDGRRNEIFIVDYSPNWSPCGGGEKILITGGHFRDECTYMCYFGQKVVTAAFVQSGVLKCCCPSGQAGQVYLSVMSVEENRESNRVLFTYKNCESSSGAASSSNQTTETTFVRNSLPEPLFHFWLEAKFDQFAHGLLDRLCAFAEHFGNLSHPNELPLFSRINSDIRRKLNELESESDISTLEQDILLLCQRTFGCVVSSGRTVFDSWTTGRTCGLTSLHYCARLGLNNLAKLFLNLHNTGRFDREFDPTVQDDYGRAPIIWACLHNKLETTIMLLPSSGKFLLETDRCTKLMPLVAAFNQRYLELTFEVTRVFAMQTNCRVPESKDFDTALWVLSDGLITWNHLCDKSAYKLGLYRGDASKSFDIPTILVAEAADLTTEKFPLLIDGVASGSSTKHSQQAAKNDALGETARKVDDVTLCESPTSIENDDDARSLKSVGAADFQLPLDAIAECSSLPLVDSFERAFRFGRRSFDSDLDSFPFPSSPSSASACSSSSLADFACQLMKGNDKTSSDAQIRAQCTCNDVERRRSTADGDLKSFFNDVIARNFVGTNFDDVMGESEAFMPNRTRKMSDVLDGIKLAPTGRISRSSLDWHLEQLTLSDREQRELFEAARVIQNAYRQYKQRIQNRRRLEVEKHAATVIQNYYRRYKQFCHVRKIHRAAALIQKHFRSYKANKKRRLSRTVLSGGGGVNGVVQSLPPTLQRADGDVDVCNGASNDRCEMNLVASLIGRCIAASSSPCSDHTYHAEAGVTSRDDVIGQLRNGKPCVVHVTEDELKLWKQQVAAIKIQNAFRGHAKRQAAARTIQRFMRRTKQKLQDSKVRNTASRANLTISLLGSRNTL